MIMLTFAVKKVPVEKKNNLYCQHERWQAYVAKVAASVAKTRNNKKKKIGRSKNCERSLRRE